MKLNPGVVNERRGLKLTLSVREQVFFLTMSTKSRSN